MTIRETAEEVLARILRQPKGGVYASRRGIVAGLAPGCGVRTLFRREGERVHLELWTNRRKQAVTLQEHPLPPDLEERAGRMLDDL
jgi:hypothetical protein